MFKKLYKKIYLSLFLTGICLLVVINVLTISVQTAIYKTTYISMGEKKVARLMDSIDLYISSVQSTIYTLSTDSTLVSELQTPTGKSLMSELDAACDYSMKISSITAYSTKGAQYQSSKISGIPNLSELTLDEGINSFVEGEQSSYLSVRTQYIASFYNNSIYPQDYGVITCCNKVYSGGEVVGYIFADILPYNIYSLIYADEQFPHCIAFISCDKFYFKSNENTEKEYLLNDSTNSYFSYCASSDIFPLKLSVYDAKTQYTNKILFLTSIQLGCSLVLCVILHFVAKFMGKYVTDRLDAFLVKTDQTSIPV